MVILGVRLFLHLRQIMKNELRDLFRDHGQELFDADSIDDLIAFAQERMRTRPNDSHAHWFLARAYYQQEKWGEALEEFNKIDRLEPS